MHNKGVCCIWLLFPLPRGTECPEDMCGKNTPTPERKRRNLYHVEKRGKNVEISIALIKFLVAEKVPPPPLTTWGPWTRVEWLITFLLFTKMDTLLPIMHIFMRSIPKIGPCGKLGFWHGQRQNEIFLSFSSFLAFKKRLRRHSPLAQAPKRLS